jgi:Protein of unknown function (DUF2786)
MSEQEKWMDKIQKILAKAERAGTQEEADVFFAKAQELMTKWGIEESMLAKEGKSTDEIIREHITLNRSGLFKSMVQMFVAVAIPNDVKVLLYSPSQYKKYAGVDLIGWKSDVEKVKMMYASLWIQSAMEQKRSMPAEVKTRNWTGVDRWRRSFRLHYAYRIGERLDEIKRITVQDQVSHSADGNGMQLAIIDRGKAVQSYMNKIPTKAAQNRSVKTDWDGANAGRSAANRADLGQTRVGRNPKGELR